MSQTNVNLERNQPVYLLDKNYYQVLVYDPDKKEDVLVTFGDQYAPKVTELILEGNPDIMESRDQYLSKNVRDNDPTHPSFWEQRYIFLSGDPYEFYTSKDNEQLLNPVFPAPSAIDPIYSYPVVVDPYAYNNYYYTPYYNPYYTPYYYDGVYPALGFATGALLGTALSGGYYGGYGGGYRGGYRGYGGGHGGHRH